MKVKNPEILQQSKNIEPSKVAQDYMFFNHVTHALKKKNVYVSKYSTTELHNTKTYNLDVLFGSKFFRRLKVSLAGKSGFKNFKFNKRKKNTDKVEFNDRFQPKVLKLKKKKSLLLLKLKTSLALYKRRINKGGIQKNVLLKKVLARFPEYKNRISLLADKSEIGLISSVIDWLRLGLQSTIAGSSLYRFRDPKFFLKHERKYFIKKNSFFTKRKAAIKSKSSKKNKIAPLRAELHTQFYKRFIFVVKKSLEKKIKRKTTGNKPTVISPMFNRVLSINTQENLLNLDIFNDIERNVQLNLNPINNKIYKPIYREFFNEFNMFKFNLFPRNALFFLDFVAMISLLARRDISLDVFGSALASILGSIHKKKHGAFMSLLTILSKKVVETKDSLISGLRFLFSGRVFGNTMAKTSLIGAGSLELNTIDAYTDHVTVDAFTVYGVFGIQIWATYKPKTPIQDYPDYELIRRQQELTEEGGVKTSSIREKKVKLKVKSKIRAFKNKKAFLRYLMINDVTNDDPESFRRKKLRQPKKIKDKKTTKLVKDANTKNIRPKQKSTKKNITQVSRSKVSKSSKPKEPIKSYNFKSSKSKENLGPKQPFKSKEKEDFRPSEVKPFKPKEDFKPRDFKKSSNFKSSKPKEEFKLKEPSKPSNSKPSKPKEKEDFKNYNKKPISDAKPENSKTKKSNKVDKQTKK